jgi:citrate synthase
MTTPAKVAIAVTAIVLLVVGSLVDDSMWQMFCLGWVAHWIASRIDDRLGRPELTQVDARKGGA